MGAMSLFFFKQKTAYERRISDWSSDVCSSDLHAATRRKLGELLIDRGERRARRDADEHAFVGRGAKRPLLGVGGLDLDHAVEQVGVEVARDEAGAAALKRVRRSEERRVGKECVRTCRSRWSPYP